MRFSNYTKVILSVLFCSLVFMTGCEEETTGFSINVTQENFCEEIAEVTCHNAFQCCTGLELETVYGIEITTTETECRRDIALQCENIYSGYIWAFENGTANLLTENVQMCLDSLIAPDDVCFPYMSQEELLTACEGDMVEGLQGSGDDCFFDFECGENAYCGPDRRCASLPGEDDPCPGMICASGLYCDYVEDYYYYGSYICVELIPSGQECSNSAQCAEGFYCSTATNTCSPVLDLGSTCMEDEACDSGFCLPGLCESDGSECYSNEQCGDPGYCESSYGYVECYFDKNCDNVCSNTNGYCQDETDCGACSYSGYSCTEDQDCYGYNKGETCEFGTCDSDNCVDVSPGNCQGNPVCADYWGTLNFCEMNPIMML